MSSATAPAGAPPPPTPTPPPSTPKTATAAKGLPTRIYNGVIGRVDKLVPDRLRPIWVHPAGPKTVFFWAPIFKWGLVIAGLSDLARPAEALSVSQCGALAATGIIWSRYSLVIKPKNWGLFSVNLFVGLTQCVQLVRAYLAKQARDQLPVGEVEIAQQN